MKRNPKQDGTQLFDCIPQAGPCPNNCSQCYYNRNFYLPIDRGHFPTLEEVGDGIVRVNSGHDSNISREYVIESTKLYTKRFFNTSIPEFDFPVPVVFTANRFEESWSWLPRTVPSTSFDKLMFVRLRVSSTNLGHVKFAVEEWREAGVPVVLTFMRYYDADEFAKQNVSYYTQRTHVTNSYWCPTEAFMRRTIAAMCAFNSEIEMCGTPISSFCKDCLCCERYYYEAKRRMQRG